MERVLIICKKSGKVKVIEGIEIKAGDILNEVKGCKEPILAHMHENYKIPSLGDLLVASQVKGRFCIMSKKTGEVYCFKKVTDKMIKASLLVSQLAPKECEVPQIYELIWQALSK